MQCSTFACGNIRFLTSCIPKYMTIHDFSHNCQKFLTDSQRVLFETRLRVAYLCAGFPIYPTFTYRRPPDWSSCGLAPASVRRRSLPWMMTSSMSLRHMPDSPWTACWDSPSDWLPREGDEDQKIRINAVI